MLKIVEYGILAVSLLTILGLVLSNARAREAPADESAKFVPAEDLGSTSEHGDAPLGSAK